MGLAATIYAQHLETYRHGHPLWYPEPISGLHGLQCPAQIGDVGYIDEDGGFRRLFNVIVDDSELNAGGVPDGFEPLFFNTNLVDIKRQSLVPGLFCSKNVRTSQIEGHAEGHITGAIGAGLAYRFTCSSEQGALLILKDDATKVSVASNDAFPEYMRQHHKSWYAFATNRERLGIQCNREDLVLVRGTIKTSAWEVAAFMESGSHVHDVTFNGQFGPVVNAGLTYSNQHGNHATFEHRSSPRSIASGSEQSAIAPSTPASTSIPGFTTDPEKDQCIFLSYYKIKYRRPLLPKKIVANAEPRDPSPDSDDDVRDIEIMTEPGSTPIRSLLDDILDYILQVNPLLSGTLNNTHARVRKQNSDADVAITSHGDIELMFPDGDIPQDFPNALNRQKPIIHVDSSSTGKLLNHCDSQHVEQHTYVPTHKPSSLPSLFKPRKPFKPRKSRRFDKNKEKKPKRWGGHPVDQAWSHGEDESLPGPSTSAVKLAPDRSI
ncbi:hypothetical protein BDW22DRAFT_1425571 [Trametopsis cervina]|nr:hypothetical protein BDW22DRAFT_1425571 [Trametopsis cervina]